MLDVKDLDARFDVSADSKGLREERRFEARCWMLENGTPPPPFFWKCVKRKGFKSFVLKLCDSKGLAGAFLRKCVNLKELEHKSRELTVESWERAVEGGGAMAFGEGMGD